MPQYFLYLIAILLKKLTTTVNEDLLIQNQMLRAQISELQRHVKGRPRYSVGFKIQMAQLVKGLCKESLDLACIVIRPSTVLGWYRMLIKKKFDGTNNRRNRGRPRIKASVEELIVRLGNENPFWGAKRITGMLKHLGYKVCTQTVVNVLNRNGVRPGPGKRGEMSWQQFIDIHRDLIVATDFFTAEVLTLRGFVTYYVLFFIDLGSRVVKIAAVTQHPNDILLMQVARNMTMVDEPMFYGKKYLIHDGDTKFSQAFKRIFHDAGIESKKISPYCPDMNAYAERWIRSIRTECLDHLILLGERSLRKAVHQYVEHYNEERPHQGRDNLVLSNYGHASLQIKSTAPDLEMNWPTIQRHQRLGGLLATYSLG